MVDATPLLMLPLAYADTPLPLRMSMPLISIASAGHCHIDYWWLTDVIAYWWVDTFIADWIIADIFTLRHTASIRISRQALLFDIIAMMLSFACWYYVISLTNTLYAINNAAMRHADATLLIALSYFCWCRHVITSSCRYDATGWADCRWLVTSRFASSMPCHWFAIIWSLVSSLRQYHHHWSIAAICHYADCAATRYCRHWARHAIGVIDIVILSFSFFTITPIFADAILCHFCHFLYAASDCHIFAAIIFIRLRWCLRLSFLSYHCHGLLPMLVISLRPLRHFAMPPLSFYHCFISFFFTRFIYAAISLCHHFLFLLIYCHLSSLFSPPYAYRCLPDADAFSAPRFDWCRWWIRLLMPICHYYLLITPCCCHHSSPPIISFSLIFSIFSLMLMPCQ